MGRIDDGRDRLLLDGVSLLFRPVQKSGRVKELDPLAPHVTVAEDYPLRGEGIGRHFRLGRGDELDERRLADVRVARDHHCELVVLDLREFSQHVAHIVEEPEIFVDLVYDRGDSCHGFLPHGSGVLSPPDPLSAVLKTHSLGVHCRPAYVAQGHFQSFDPEEGLDGVPIKGRLVFEDRKGLDDMDKAIVDGA